MSLAARFTPYSLFFKIFRKGWAGWAGWDKPVVPRVFNLPNLEARLGRLGRLGSSAFSQPDRLPRGSVTTHAQHKTKLPQGFSAVVTRKTHDPVTTVAHAADRYAPARSANQSTAARTTSAWQGNGWHQHNNSSSPATGWRPWALAGLIP